MTRFYLDEDVQSLVTPSLRGAGHDVLTTVAARRLRAWDTDQLLYATENDYVLVTHNRRDYRALHEGWLVWSSRWQEPRPHGGILTLDMGQRLNASVWVAAIATLLANTALVLPNHTYDWYARGGGGQWVEWRG